MKSFNGEHEEGTNEAHLLCQRVAELEQEIAALKEELKQTEVKNQECEHLLQLVMEHNPTAIAVYDQNLHYIAASERYRTNYHLDDQEIIGRHHYDLFPVLSQHWKDAHQHCMAGEVEVSDEDTFVRQDGSIEYNRWECRPWYTATGSIGGIITFTEVITTNKEIENELRWNKNVLQGFLDHASFAMYAKEAQGRYMVCNTVAAANLGLKPEDVIGKTDYDLFDAEQATIITQDDQHILATGACIIKDVVIPCEDGSHTFLSNWFPIFDTNGEVYAIGGISTDVTERKRDESALRENEERLQFILEGSSDGAWDTNIITGDALLSDRYREMLGYTLEELPNSVEAWINLIHPEDTPTVQEVLQAYLQGDSKVYEIEHRLKHASGEWRWFLSRGKVVVYDEHGTPARMTGTITDIHERKLQESELQIFKALAEHAPDAIGIADTNGTMTYANATFRQLFGYGDETMSMKNTAFFTEQEQRERLPAIFEAILAGSWTGLLTAQHSDGSTFPTQVSGFVIRNSSGCPYAFPAIIRDMSEQKKKEAELQRFAAVIENSSDFISVATLEGKALYVNRAGRQMVGIDPEQDITQMLVPDFHLSEDQQYVQQQILPAVMQQGRWWSEFRLKHMQTGEAVPIDYNLFLVKDQYTEEPIALAAVIRDLTEQKRSEQERAALQDKIIESQRAALRELSSPLIPISDQVVIMPLIGTIDTQRAQEIMETLLEGVAYHHADIAIIDITGVKVVDTQVANALIQAAQAARLLGAQVILTGIGPIMAQTLIHLGVDLSSMMTLSTLQHGIEYSLTREVLVSNGSSKQHTRGLSMALH